MIRVRPGAREPHHDRHHMSRSASAARPLSTGTRGAWPRGAARLSIVRGRRYD
jgi:hypothetical protein